MGQDLAAGPVEDHAQVDEALGPGHIREVNGLITNDKFCVSRLARLTLAWSRYEAWRQRTVKVLACPSAETVSSGGRHETSIHWFSAMTAIAAGG
jgi:hypothetical protein